MIWGVDPTEAGVAIEFRVCIFSPEALSKTVQKMWRQGFGSEGWILAKIGWGVRASNTAGVLVSLLLAGSALILFPGLARAQTGTMVLDQSAYQAVVSQSNITIGIIFSGSTDATATVDFSTSGGTAVPGLDYVAVSNTLVFAAQVPTNGLGTATNATQTVSIQLLNNGVAGSTQTVELALSNPTGSAVLGSPSSAVLTIINDELEELQFAPPFSVDDTDTVATITVVRVGATNGTVTVDYKTSDESALAGVDYTTTTGTVTLTDGVISNTFTIPIISPPLGALETNKTLKLTLTNPTGGASLGNPSTAQLTIVATGPPVIQLSAATDNVHEHVGHATITAIRFNDSSVTVTVDYATSDGTAISGIDYFGTSGTLVFLPGTSQSSFTFAFQEFKTFQSNKTVNVTLSNVQGPSASLGAPSNAVITIVNDEPQTITFTNAGGGVVTLLLKSAGMMLVSQNEPLVLALAATDEGSTLTIKVKKRKEGGTGSLQIDQITGDGSCRLIDARDFDVVGSGIALGDLLTRLRIHDLLNGASISANGAVNQNTTITAHNLDDGCAISLGSRLQRLTAARFGDGATIDAPAIGGISIKGDKRNGVPGDFEGAITVSGDGIATNQNGLGTLAVSGTISNASIAIANGSLGSISAFQMIDSTVFIGYTPDDPSNPLISGTFMADLHLSSVSVRSTVNGFVNSDIAASEIGSVRLSSVLSNNGGTVFGVAASQRISGVTVRSPLFRWMPAGPDDQSLGDFHVLH